MNTDLRFSIDPANILSRVSSGDDIQDVTKSMFDSAASKAHVFTANDLHQQDMATQKQQQAVAQGIADNKELLATPGKLDSMVSASMQDIYPFTKRPDTKGQEVRTDAIDKALGDHPLAGSATAIKEKFRQALSDPKYALASHNQLLEAVKQDHINQKDANGVSLLDKANQIKYDKDRGFWSHSEDTNYAKPLGYDEFTRQKELESPNDTSAKEAMSWGGGLAAVGAVASTIATGGLAAIPLALGSIAMSTAAGAAIAVPEFKLMDKAMNAVATNDGTEQTNTILQLGVGLAAGALTGGLAAKGFSKSLAKAMEHEKLGSTAALVASYTGSAPEALKAFNAGRLAKASALEAENASLAVKAENIRLQREDFLTRADQESAVFTSELKDMGTPEAKSFLNDRLTKLNIAPENAHVMGLDAVDYKLTQKSPSKLYNYLSDDGVTAVHAAIEDGETQEMAIINQFNKEAALKKLSLSETKTPVEIADDARKALNLPTFNESLVGSSDSKIAKGSGRKIKDNSIEMGPSLTEQLTEKVPSQEELLLGTTGGKPTLSKGGKIADNVLDFGPKEVTTTPEVIPPTQAEILTGKNTSILANSSGNKITDNVLNLGPKTEPTVQEQAVTHNALLLGPSADKPVIANASGKKIVTSSIDGVNQQKKSTVGVIGLGLTAGALTFQASGAPPGAVLAKSADDKVQEKGIASRLLDFISPSEANASVTSAVVGMVVPKVVGETFINKVGRTLEGLIDEAIQKGFVGMPVTKGQVTMNAPMRQIQTAPELGRTVGAFNKAVGKTTTFMDGLVNSVNSPAFFGWVYGKAEFRLTNQMASMQTAIAHDTESGIMVVNNILKPALGEEKAGQEIAEKMKPIQDAYNEVAIPLRLIEVETAKAEGVIKNLKAELGGVNDAELTARIADEETKLKGLTEENANYSKQLPQAEDAYNEAKHEMLSTYKSARISYAVEEPDLMKDARYTHLYTDEEKAAVQQITDVMNHYKARATEIGMPVIDDPFMHHSMDKIKLNEAFQQRLESFGVRADNKSIPLSTFLERSKYSKQMIPDIQRNMYEYIPDAERRINVANLWDVKNENGWHAFSQNELVKGNKVWNDFFDNMKKAYNPQEQTTMNDVINKYTSLETARLLFGAPSAAFKHLFKNEGTWATLGFVNSMKHIPESLETASRNAVNESFYKLGLESKLGGRSQKELFVRAVTKQRSMLSMMDGYEKDPGVASMLDNALQKINNVGGVGIQMVESFDRTHTVLAAMDMAAKKGMTAEQAMSSLYDTILKNNFLGGGLNPSWMKNPKIRALMLFQGTPFKIMERRLANAMALGDDVKTTYGIIRNRDVAKNLEELQGLGRYVLDGQNEFKQNMIYDALTAHKDAFGSSVSAQFMREAVITGGVIAGGSAMGLDFQKHSIHLPFIKEGGSAPELSVNPVVGAAWKTAFDAKSTFNPIGQDDKTFFPARFLKNYMDTTGGVKPLMLHKFERLTANDIPAIYKDSAFRYLFSVPASK